MEKRAKFHGSIPALVTPFKDGKIDEPAFRSLVDWQIASGSNGLVPVGTTGESPTLSHEEHRRVVDICIDEARGRVPVIAGAGSNNTSEAVDLARHAERAGADAVLVVTPYYNKPTQEGLYHHFRAINDAIGIPIIIYNIPPRSVIDMSVDTMKRLYELKNIVGVKDATGDVGRISRQRIAMGPEFIQLSGEDMTALACVAAGGHGCISVTANAAPGPLRRIDDARARRRLRPCAEVAGPTGAAACGDLRRARRRRGEICAEPARPHPERGPSAAAAGRREHRSDHPSRDGPRRPAQRLIRSSRIGAGVAAEKEKPNYKVVADNRRARHDYEIGEVFEAGLMLTGPEVKSLRTGKATVAESYAAVDRNGELFLYNANIPEYLQANRFNHEPRRPRKLLLHAKEIVKLAKGVEREGMTIVPLRVYFNAKGRAKVAIALARGKQLHDKREAEKTRDWNRDKSRLMRQRG